MSNHTEHRKVMKEFEAKHTRQPEQDNVNHPSHYRRGGVECIDALQSALTDEQYEGFLQGNVFKYVFRANFKGKRREDLEKASWYLDRLLDFTEDGIQEEEGGEDE